ncbi:hypothetical protein AB1Y20_012020 [Prymnesium parvum]|uniref:Uncharacterized protein n=1 Tax=Prymnesium parvum TaxID=97485 RepID=A0AB34IMB3_PRYPA
MRGGVCDALLRRDRPVIVGVVGNSITFGAGVRANESWPRLLQASLRRAYPNLLVLNGAVRASSADFAALCWDELWGPQWRYAGGLLHAPQFDLLLSDYSFTSSPRQQRALLLKLRSLTPAPAVGVLVHCAHQPWQRLLQTKSAGAPARNSSPPSRASWVSPSSSQPDGLPSSAAPFPTAPHWLRAEVISRLRRLGVPHTRRRAIASLLEATDALRALLRSHNATLLPGWRHTLLPSYAHFRAAAAAEFHTCRLRDCGDVAAWSGAVAAVAAAECFWRQRAEVALWREARVPFTSDAAALQLAFDQVVTTNGGSHPNARGHRLMARAVEQMLREQCDRLASATPPRADFPEQVCRVGEQIQGLLLRSHGFRLVKPADGRAAGLVANTSGAFCVLRLPMRTMTAGFLSLALERSHLSDAEVSIQCLSPCWCARSTFTTDARVERRMYTYIKRSEPAWLVATNGFCDVELRVLRFVRGRVALKAATVSAPLEGNTSVNTDTLYHLDHERTEGVTDATRQEHGIQ